MSEVEGQESNASSFSGTDLASRWLGGSVIAANDESFGEKENLLTPTKAAFEPGHYGHRGEVVDGWETRRRREPGHDWAIIRLGCPGIVTSVDVDTSFFTGNYPEFCRIEACGREGYPSPSELLEPGSDWAEIIPRSSLQGGTHNRFNVSDPHRYTHIRLSIFPDGGVARLRVYGQAVPDPRHFDGLTIDLASQDHGGLVVNSSDGFYTSAGLLNRPDRARTMGEGWETRRRRDDGHDYAIISLAFTGHVRLAEIDTAHFKYNATGALELFGSTVDPVPEAGSAAWIPLLDCVRLQPDTRHLFTVAKSNPPVRSVKLVALPDGGISRIRLWGTPDRAARRRAGYRWFNSLPAGQANACLRGAGISMEMAMLISGQRPLTENWIREQLDSNAIAGHSRPQFNSLIQMIEGDGLN